MTIFPFQINEAGHLYNRLAKLKPSAIVETEQGEVRDEVNISAEAKKRTILEQTRTEVLAQIRNVR
jgi:hypothetical protein